MTTTAPLPRKPAKSSASQWQIVWRQFLRNPLARIGLVLLALLYLMALFAGFLMPYGLQEYSTEQRISWASPTPVHIRDDQGRWRAPFVYGVKREVDMNTFRDKYVEEKGTVCPVRWFAHRPAAPYRLFGVIPSDVKLFSVAENCKLYLWGSDNLGRDQFSRIMYGSQISLTIGILATILSTVLGLILGGIAGYFKGWADTIIMRSVEVVSAIPDLFLLATLRAVFPININPILIFYILIVILSLIGWTGLARVVRGQLLSAREQDYVQAATALGASEPRIIGQHLLPNTATFIIISTSLSIPGYILGESGLSFLGIGIVEPYASWGSLLKLAQDGGFESISARSWVLIPGLFILLAVLAWQFVGDGLRDAFDPRRRR